MRRVSHLRFFSAFPTRKYPTNINPTYLRKFPLYQASIVSLKYPLIPDSSPQLFSLTLYPVCFPTRHPLHFCLDCPQSAHKIHSISPSQRESISPPLDPFSILNHSTDCNLADTYTMAYIHQKNKHSLYLSF